MKKSFIKIKKKKKNTNEYLKLNEKKGFFNKKNYLIVEKIAK